MTDDRDSADVWKLAADDFDSVVELTRDLVRIPSRGGIDPYEPILDHMQRWLAEHGLPCRRLPGPDGATVALVSEVTGGRPGPRYVLDACLDTAPYGDEAAWTLPPVSGQIAGGWLHGRGSADSKAEPRSSPTSPSTSRPSQAAWPAPSCCCTTSMSTPEGSGEPMPTSRGRTHPNGSTG